MSKILVSFSPEFIPVIKELAANEHEISTTHQPFAQTLGNFDIKAQPLAAITTNETRALTTKLASKMIAALETKRNWKFNGLLPSVQDFITDDLGGFLYAELADIILFVLSLDTYQPDIIMLHNDVEPLYRAAAFWASANNKPCLHIPHSIYQNIENRFDIHRIVTASHLASSGDYQSAWYANCGLVASNIYETGLPQFDEWVTMILDKNRAKVGLGLDVGRPVILYASSWRQDTNLLGMHDGVNETYQAILDCAKKMPEVQFLIKVHPRAHNSSQEHLDLAKEVKAKVTITPHHLPQCLQAADLILAYGPSNILFEAAHIPWLRLACTSGFETDQNIYKIPTDPANSDQMITAFLEILSMPVFDMSQFRHKYLGSCDGQNFKRIAILVEKLLEEFHGQPTAIKNTD
jgi:hypothetical protein